MVYIHFPNNLTEEEQMLQAKYQKLKKKVCLSIQTNCETGLYIFQILEKGTAGS